MFDYAAEIASDDTARLALLDAAHDYRLTATMAVRYAGDFYAFDYPFTAGPSSATDEIVAEGRRLMDSL